MGETALYQAVEMESLSQVETLLKFGGDPNIPQSDGLIPLHAAALKQNIQIVEILLKHGSNPNFENKLFSQTPVHFAIKHSAKPAILMLLVRYNGSLSIRDKNNKRPLDYVDSDEIRDTLNMLRLEKEDAFKTPQKQSHISYLNHTQSNRRGSGKNLNFTPSKTASYAFNKITLKNESDGKDFSYNNVGGNIQNIRPTKLFSNYENEKEFQLDEVENEGEFEIEENTRKDSENIFIQNPTINTSNNLNYSQTEYVNTNNNNNENNFTINMENRFDSFVTKDAGNSKMNTPKTHEDGISDRNPLDTLYSNGNTIKSNHNSLIKNNDGVQAGRRDYSYNNTKNSKSRMNTPEHLDNPSMSLNHITEHEMEESTEKKGEVPEFIDDSLEDDEELVPNRKIQMYYKHNQYQYPNAINIQNEMYNNTEKTEVEITYTPSKISYIISDVPLTSNKKNNNEISVIEQHTNQGNHVKNNSDLQQSLDNKIMVKKINFSKIKYHNKPNDNRDNSTNSNNINESYHQNTSRVSNMANSLKNNLTENINNSHINRQNSNTSNRNIKDTIHLRDMDIKLNPSHFMPSPQERKINLSPSYKKRLNFSKVSPISPTNSVQNSHRINTYGSNSNAQIAIPYNTIGSADEEKMHHLHTYNKNNGQVSTRNTSAHYIIEDNIHYNYQNNTYSNYPPKDRYNRKTQNNLNETINTGHECSNSNRTIIHYGEAGSNKIKKLKKISVVSSNFSRRNSPKSFCRRSPGGDYLDTIYCMNTESSKSNISTVDAKKLHDWLSSIGMQNYYSNFLENGLFSVDELIKITEDANTRLNYVDFENMGIRKPGHIYRLLVKLELDAKLIDESVYNIIFDKTSERNKITENNVNNLNIPNYSLKFSGDKYVCCGLMNKVTSNNKNSSVNMNANNGKIFLRYDLISCLKMYNLPHLRKNFLHNGFDSFEFFILQMFSSFPLDDQMIEDCLHVYSKKERKIVLSILNREVMIINNKLLNISNMDTKSYDSEFMDNIKFEKNKVDEGCKMCLIF